jgi:hypothetical protein
MLNKLNIYIYYLFFNIFLILKLKIFILLIFMNFFEK